MREPRALWLLLIAISAVYALFASVVSVGYTAIYGLVALVAEAGHDRASFRTSS